MHCTAALHIDSLCFHWLMRRPLPGGPVVIGFDSATQAALYVSIPVQGTVPGECHVVPRSKDPSCVVAADAIREGSRGQRVPLVLGGGGSALRASQVHRSQGPMWHSKRGPFLQEAPQRQGYPGTMHRSQGVGHHGRCRRERPYYPCSVLLEAPRSLLGSLGGSTENEIRIHYLLTK